MNNEILEDIFDLIKFCALPEYQQDEWAIISRVNTHRAAVRMAKNLKNKTIALDYDNNTITIGKNKKVVIKAERI